MRGSLGNIANNSFALAAVIILVMASLSVSIIYVMNQRELAQIGRTRDTILMDQIITETHTSILSYGEMAAMLKIYFHNQPGRNVTDIQKDFELEMKTFLENNFPAERGRFKIGLVSTNITITNRNHKLIDIVPAVKATENEASRTFLGGDIGETTDIVSWLIVGSIEYAIEEDGHYLNKTLWMDKEISERYPFLESRNKKMNNQFTDDGGPLGRTISYILTTVAQYRALQGYGWTDKKLEYALQEVTEFTIDLESAKDKEVTDIVTMEDVETATNLAILLNTAKIYRCYDAGALGELEKSKPGIRRIVEDWIKYESIDPADLIVLYEGFAQESSEKQLNLELILLQGLMAIIENVLLELFRTLGIDSCLEGIFERLTEFLKLVNEVWDSISDNWIVELTIEKLNEVISKTTEIASDVKDDIEDNFKELLEWISGGGKEEAYKPNYRGMKLGREMMGNVLDLVNISRKLLSKPRDGWPSEYVCIQDKEFKERVAVRGVPEYEQLSYNYSIDNDGNVSNGYEKNVTVNTSYITGYNSKVYNVTVRFVNRTMNIGFKRTPDITSQRTSDLMWDKFYNQTIKGSKDCDLGHVATLGLRSALALKSIFNDIVVNFTSKGGILAETIDQNRYIDNIVPSDHRSFLQQVYSKTSETIGIIEDYYCDPEQDGYKEIKNKLESVFGNFQTVNQIIGAIQAFILENFETLCGVSGTYSYTYTHDSRVLAGNDLVDDMIGDKKNVIIEIEQNPELVFRKSRVNILEFEHRPWKISSSNGYYFDSYKEVETDTIIGDRALYKLSANPYANIPYRTSTRIDVFEALEEFVNSAFRDMKDHELNGTDGVISKLEKAIVVPGEPERFLPQKGVKSMGLVICQALIDKEKGIFATLGSWIRTSVFKIIRGSEFTNTRYFLPMMYEKDFEFYDGDLDSARSGGRVDTDSVNLSQEPKYLTARPATVLGEDVDEDIFKYILRNYNYSRDTLLVNFFDPNDEETTSEYVLDDISGTYYNDPTVFQAPFQTQWNIRIVGIMNITSRLCRLGLMANGTHYTTWCNESVTIDTTVTVNVMTGWALEGIDYSLSIDTMNFLIKLFTSGFEELEKYFGDQIDEIMKFMEMLGELVTKIVAYANDIINLLNDQIQKIVQLVKEIIGSELITTITDALDQINMGKISFRFYGIRFLIEYNRDYYDDKPKENRVPLFSITITKDEEIDLTLAVSSEPDSDYGMSVTLVGQFKVCGIQFDMIVDPFLAVYNNIFYINGLAKDKNGDGWGLELKLPELHSYKKIEKSITAGPPTGITIPILGISVFPKIGVNLKYSFPERDDLIVNEFDYTRMEVYNPTSKNIDMEGWTVENRNQPVKRFSIGESLEIPAFGFKEITYDHYYEREANRSLKDIAAAGLENRSVTDAAAYVIDKLDGVDNSFLGTGKGKISAGEGLKLLTPDGEQVDQTPIRRQAGNGSSWQRKYDAGYIWKQAKETFGQENNNEEPKLDIKAIVLNALMDSFKEAYVETMLQQKIKAGNVTLADVVELLRSTINKFVEKLLELIRTVVIEVEFYIDLGIGAIGQAKSTGGIRLSFIFDGEGIALLLEWLVQSLGVLVNRLITGNTGGGYPPLPGKLPEHMFLRYSNYFDLDQLPPSISENLPPNFSPSGMNINVVIQTNLAMLGMLIGKDMGRFAIDFGLFLSGKTSPIAQTLYGEAGRNDPDLWILKGRIYQIKGGEIAGQ